MTALVLEPHPDDAVLFATWSILEHSARVVTVLGISNTQGWLGVTSEMREIEHARAMEILGVEHEMWPIADDSPDWEAVRACMIAYDAEHDPELVFAPASERGGHEQHTLVGDIAGDVFGDRVLRYMTYSGAPSEKTTSGIRVPYRQEWIQLKHAALACYTSQITALSGAHRHFVSDLFEYRVSTNGRPVVGLRRPRAIR